MEGYKSLREAVASVGNPAFIWRDVINGNTFNLNELYQMGNSYDKMFSPDGWNYFVTFPTGEIGLLSTDDNEIVLLFVPINAQSAQDVQTKQSEISTQNAKPVQPVQSPQQMKSPNGAPQTYSPQPLQKAVPRPKFCTKCGSALPTEGSFCKMCGEKIRGI